MRTTTIAALLAGALCGCHDHGDSAVSHSADVWYVRYDNGHPVAAASSDAYILSHENELFALVNDHRVAMGLPALIHEGRTRDVARAHSIHMSIGDFTGLVNPEGDDPGDRADLAGLSWTTYAENIEYDLHSPFDVCSEWLASPGMHDNIDDPHVTHAGVGFEHDAESMWNDYWTMDFRRP
ncbi:MAG: CAP domain-containing protein [Planctomycetes bacterium]|nr:CAP domain-containing protein [Planctomycetota bacterium]